MLLGTRNFVEFLNWSQEFCDGWLTQFKISSGEIAFRLKGGFLRFFLGQILSITWLSSELLNCKV